MKQILLILTLTLFSLLSFSQNPSRGTSTQLSFGQKSEYTGGFVFNSFKRIDKVNILIDDGKIMIDSKVPQIYHITSDAEELEDFKGSRWYAMDGEGTKCRVYLYMDKNYEVYLAVEYNDFSWIYIVNPSK